MAVIKATLGPIGRTARRTPNLTEPVAYTGTVEPTGTLVDGKRKYTQKDFQDAYNAAHRAAGPNGKARVWMEPGWLEGFGAGSGKPAAMEGVGVAGRSSRILFYPKGALGSVSLYGKSAKFVDFRCITLGGIQGGDEDNLGFLWVGGGDHGLWRSTVGFFNAYGKTDAITDDVTFTEVVVPTARIYESDSAAFRSADTVPGPISHGRVEGCWISPTYRPTGTTSHTDTLQFSGASDYDYFDVIDSVLIASTNHNLIVGGAGHVSLDNVALVSHTRGKLWYPPVGVAQPPSEFEGNAPGVVDSPIAINGSGRPGQFAMNNVDIIGEIKNAGAGMKGSRITNTRCSDRTSVDALRKTYGVTAVVLDEALGAITVAQMEAMYGTKPTKASLHALWSGTTGPMDPGDPEEPEGPEEPVDTIDPTVSFVTPNTTPLSGTAVIVIAASDTAPGTIRMNAFSTVADGKTVQLGSGTKGAGDQYVLTFPLTGIATTGPVQFPVTVKVTDSGGRTATATRTYTVDNSGTTPPATNQPPVVTFLQPAAGTVLPRQGQALLRARATDDRLIGVVGWEARNEAGTITELEGFGELTTSAVYERAIDMATVPTDTSALRAFATEAGDNPLTTRTDWVPMTVAPEINETPPSDFVLELVSLTPETATFQWSEAIDPEGQDVSYVPKLDSLVVGDAQEERTCTYRGLTPGQEYDAQIDASDLDGNVKASNEITFTTPPADRVGPPIPGLTVTDITATSAVLHGAAVTDPSTITRYTLKQDGRLLAEPEVITPLLNYPIVLKPGTRSVVTLVAWDGAGNPSEPATLQIDALPAPVVVQPGWFQIGPKPIEDAVGPVNGYVLARYSSDLKTTDDRQITPTQQVVNVSQGHLFDPSKPNIQWRAYRSSDANDYVEWVEKFLVNDRYVERRRKFRIPPTATGGQVNYQDLLWFDDAPTGTALPVWAQELDAKVARVEAAALVVKDAVDALAFTLIQDTDGVYYPAPMTEG